MRFTRKLFLIIVKILLLWSCIFLTDNAYAYDDSYAESHESYSYGYTDYDESQEEQPEPYSVPIAESVPEDDNCMGLEGYMMTEELKSCCTLLVCFKQMHFYLQS